MGIPLRKLLFAKTWIYWLWDSSSIFPNGSELHGWFRLGHKTQSQNQFITCSLSLEPNQLYSGLGQCLCVACMCKHITCQGWLKFLKGGYVTRCILTVIAWQRDSVTRRDTVTAWHRDRLHEVSSTVKPSWPELEVSWGDRTDQLSWAQDWMGSSHGNVTCWRMMCDIWESRHASHY